MLSDLTVTARLTETKATAEIKALGDLFKMLNDDPDRAAYGAAYVFRAAAVLFSFFYGAAYEFRAAEVEGICDE